MNSVVFVRPFVSTSFSLLNRLTFDLMFSVCIGHGLSSPGLKLRVMGQGEGLGLGRTRIDSIVVSLS